MSARAEAARRIAEWKAGAREDRTPDAEWRAKTFGSRTPPLTLCNLGLEELPEELRGLERLEILDLAFNRIAELPPWIAELESVRALDLSDNLLRHLPDVIGSLPLLNHLWVARNRLSKLPETLRNVSLKGLALHGNRLGIPTRTLNRAPADILRYYFDLRSGSRPLQELKILIVGRGKAGKTTLLKQLAGETPDVQEPETHSIAIRELSLSCPSGDVRTRVWDFGGQEILHSTHQFFLTERSLYLLVVEPRTGLAQQDAEYWLELIAAHGSGSPVIVVLNWSHDRSWHIDEVKLKRDHPFIVDFIATDAFHGDGIDALRTTIETTVQNMPDVWAPVSGRWREIMDTVAAMPENFLSDRQYRRLCDDFGEHRPDAHAELADTLHRLGLALYFGKDSRLREMRILNPSWVTGGVYAVIRSPSVRARHGRLTSEDMVHVLFEAERENVVLADSYPEETHQFILDLMRAFELCYASGEKIAKPTRYLVPELLPEFEPTMDDDWEHADVRLRYRYDVLPPGLLPRLIVRTHSLSEGAPHWRRGVVLRHADAQALIREEPKRRELQVFAIGANDDTRRVLVAMVRRELELLHGELRVQPLEELELSGDGGRWISVKTLREFEELRRTSLQETAEIHVAMELDKLLPAEARAIDRMPENAPLPVRLFVSYAHEDERQLKRLDAILDVLEQQHGLGSWMDRRLIAGDDWDKEIRTRLETMDIFLFIASARSLVRPYVRDVELRRARERHAAGEVEIATVKLEPCACDDDPFLGKLQRLAGGFRSVAEFSPKSVVWEQVRKDLLAVIARVRAKRSR